MAPAGSASAKSTGARALRVPHDIVRQRAHEHVRANARVLPVIDRAHFQFGRLHRAKRALDVGQTLVRGDDAGRTERLCGHMRPNDIDPIERRFGRDARLVARVREAGLGDGVGEVIRHLEAPEHAPHAHADAIAPVERRARIAWLR